MKLGQIRIISITVCLNRCLHDETHVATLHVGVGDEPSRCLFLSRHSIFKLLKSSTSRLIIRVVENVRAREFDGRGHDGRRESQAGLSETFPAAVA